MVTPRSAAPRGAPRSSLAVTAAPIPSSPSETAWTVTANVRDSPVSRRKPPSGTAGSTPRISSGGVSDPWTSTAGIGERDRLQGAGLAAHGADRDIDDLRLSQGERVAARGDVDAQIRPALRKDRGRDVIADRPHRRVLVAGRPRQQGGGGVPGGRPRSSSCRCRPVASPRRCPPGSRCCRHAGRSHSQGPAAWAGPGPMPTRMSRHRRPRLGRRRRGPRRRAHRGSTRVVRHSSRPA